MATSGLRLLGSWASPFVMRPMIALNMKALEYEFLQESFGSKTPLLLQSNPVYKKIPVLLHGEKPICESLIIVQYIDDVWANGPSILPADAYDRAIARFWGTYVDDKWFPAMRGIATAQGEEAKAAAIEQVESGLKLLEEALEKCGKGKPFFGGESIGYVDIAFGSYLAWLKVTEIMNNVKLLDSEKIPLLTAWSERFCSDAYVKDVMPETGKLLEFAKVIFKK
eukprot:TRINITY_DN390_c0_g1_i1.p1 TRINITY_DN390_c0_g1~~TRINITY_DN390_c0_g1_i1.p1  ORF type:complete len:224 (-),score=27.22 TRINITY_DN390_c0_g1_i1:32-703(-)